MTCFYCKGDMERTTGKFVVDLGPCVVIVRNVPALICKQCGETAYDDATMARLEEIVSTVRASMVQEVAILDYTPAA